MARFSTVLVEGFRFVCALERVIDGVLSRLGVHRRYYSQKGQDRWVIERAAAGLRNGYFVEIGAGDGRTHSNTFVLERDHGWTGLLIEPNPDYADAIRRFRTSKHVTFCVDAEPGQHAFMALGYMGGLIGDDTDYSPARRPSVVRRHSDKILQVPCRSLAEILADDDAPAVIDFLSVDVEGAEYRILKDFPFDRYTFNALVIERPTREVHELLTAAGYVLDRLHLYDGFYLSADAAALKGIEGRQFSGIDPKPF